MIHTHVTICTQETQSTNKLSMIHKYKTQSTNIIHDLYEHKTCFLRVWVVLSHQITNLFVDRFWHLSTEFWHYMTGTQIHACVQPIRGLVGAIMSRLLRVLPRPRPACLLLVRFPPPRCRVDNKV